MLIASYKNVASDRAVDIAAALARRFEGCRLRQKVQIDGRTFDSKLEGRVYVDLKRQQEAGLITALQCQVKFALEVHGVLIAHYIADFTFRDSSFAFVVADAKGVRTREYILKKKLMKACHGIDIKEYRREKSRARKPNPV